MEQGDVRGTPVLEGEHVVRGLVVDVERVHVRLETGAPERAPDPHRLVADGVASMGGGYPLVDPHHSASSAAASA